MNRLHMPIRSGLAAGLWAVISIAGMAATNAAAEVPTAQPSSKAGPAMMVAAPMASVKPVAACVPPSPVASTRFTISDLTIRGEIEGENVVFTLAFTADAQVKPCLVPLVAGEIACRESDLPRGAVLSRDGSGCFWLTLDSRGRQSVKLVFASRPVKEGDWRRTRFAIPLSAIREASVQCDRDDLEVNFPGALSVNRQKAPKGKTVVTAFLGISEGFEMRWKPEIKKLEAERVVECVANMIASAGVGALHLDTILSYRVVQGSLNKLTVALSSNINVTQVRGEDIQDWSIDRQHPAQPLLTVSLSRPKDTQYLLQINGEMVLPEFPCKFNLPIFVPRDVIRANGFLTVGTDSAIKLLVNQALGLTQIDQAAFPQVKLGLPSDPARPLPARTPFTYQFANMPFTFALEADDVVTAVSADDRLILSVVDNDAIFNASIELDVRDAPTREVVVETDPTWVVAGVTGAEIADYDVRDEAGHRVIRAYFRNAVQGRILVDLRLERALGDKTAFSLPAFKVRDAKSERGYLVMSGEKGLRLKVEKLSGLIEAHTGSTPMHVPDAQWAFRFKDAAWQASVGLERTAPVIHSEMFHLISMGDGVLYGSALITYHISGAPIREFKLTIPAEYQNVEFTGRDVRNWEHSNTVWTVSLQEKILGDYTLLVAYDRPVSYAGGELAIGGVQTEGTESEVGYLVVASSASLKLDEQSRDPSIIRIDRNEVPEAYALLVKDPFLATYKYIKKPHTSRLKATRYETEPLLGQVADHVSLRTEISREGETVSTVTYFVKNASSQYLALALPKNARLWSTRFVEPDGKRTDLAALQGDDGLLVPIPRPRDLNTPIQIELVYAQNHGRLGFFFRRIRLAAPTVLKTPIPFTQWTVQLPATLAMIGSSGNVASDHGTRMNGLGTVLLIVARVVQTLVQEATAWCFLGAIALAAVCLVAWLTGRRRPTLGTLIAGGIVLILAILLSPASFHILSALKQAFTSASHNLQQLSFTRSVSLPDDPSLFLVLNLVPNWVGSAGSLWLFLIAGLLGVGTMIRFHLNAIGLAVGLTLLTVALAQLTLGRDVLALGILVMLPVVVAGILLKFAVQAGHQRKQARAWADGADLPPFQPTAAETSAPAASPAVTPRAVIKPTVLPSEAGPTGYIRLPLLIAIELMALGLSTLAVFSIPSEAPLSWRTMTAEGLTIQTIDATITGPATGRDAEKSAQVVMRLDFEATQPTTSLVLSAACVLTEFKTDAPRRVSLLSTPAGYALNISRDGEYQATLTFQVLVRETNGQWVTSFDLPAHLKNHVVLKLPESGLDIQSDEAVYIKTIESSNQTDAVAMFESVGHVRFTWRPKMRKTELEKTVFFCEVNSLMTFDPGVINGLHLVRYQIAQGEIRTLALSIPEQMNVTSVSAPGLSTWRFDPATRNLEAILQKPASGSLILTLVTQTPREGLPYAAVIGAPQVKEAVRQRGALALAAPETVQIVVEPKEGLNAMNISDFAPELAVAKDAAAPAIRRAFRYQQLPVMAKVQAEQVLPEIRVEEKGSLSVADERIVLSTQLKVTVAKAGIFSLRLTIPDGFDVESLGGQDVSHWDEVKDKERGVIVHFTKPVTGSRDLNLVLSRMEKGLEDTIAAPRVGVVNAFKHSGNLVVSGERGVRLTTLRREGVSEVNPRDLGINQQGLLAFSLLRPDWVIVLKAEVLTPTIKPELLQRVDVTEGMLKGRAYIRYRIENAGCKVFLLQAPRTNTLLTLSGPDIAKVQIADATQGIWQVTLHGKVENNYMLVAGYQIPFDPGAGNVTVTPLLPINTDPPRGYLTVMSDGRVQIKPRGEVNGLKAEEARSIPATFGAGDLSDAILCYRTIQPNYALPLSVVRHESAESLPARVTETRLVSVVSEDGKMLTQMTVRMNIGNLRFLKIKLPQPADRLWSAFVNGKVAAPSREGALYRIPLEAVEVDEPASVELLYASHTVDRLLLRRLDGPQLDLPLTDILWTVYVIPNRFYYGFGGTLECLDSGRITKVVSFDTQNYRLNTQRQMDADVEKAKNAMALGEQYARQGKQKLANKSLESALTYSQGKADVNEDARVQYHNLIQQQAVVGLVDRRNAVRESQNIQMEQPSLPAPDNAPGGQPVKPQQGQQGRSQQSLSAKENDSLRILSEKILRQQEAAAGVSQAIRVTLPEHGRKLDFARSLQVDPNVVMTVDFKSFSGTGARRWLALGFVLGLLIIYRVIVGRIRARSKAA
ncbi:MAG: hypothetical protein PHW60_03180 [Kiritimatiellae bacterium]|nr:hypothetical protein [Kiritimatiellia bacterium]